MNKNATDEDYMRLALEQAQSAAAQDEVPVGAVLVDATTGAVVAAAGNRTRTDCDPTAHAEILVIRDMCRRDNAQRIPACHLYVTLEPCTMCSAAISFARIEKLVYGAPDPKGGAVESGVQFFGQETCHHRPSVITGGVLAQPCGDILRAFFKDKRMAGR